ncbi:MAG: flippase-like domain-containing protein [Candidatus Omnitrophica bacterium]|nr:flippase-like domain-containing protein [Candidatus Omnitrophota bacterium]
MVFKKQLNLILRLFISLGLVFILFKIVPYRELISQFKEVNPVFVIASFLIFVSLHILGVWRWQVGLSALGLKIKFKDLFFLLFCGLFFNLIFPSVIAQDVFRGGLLGLKEKGAYRKVAASLVIDRFSGYFALSLVAIISFLLGRSLIQEKSVALAVFLLFLGVLFAALFIFNKRFFHSLVFFSHRFPSFKSRISEFHDYLYVFRRDFLSFFKVFLLSLVIQILVPLSIYILALAFGLSPGPFIFFILVPIIMAVATVPVTIAGIGTREALMVYFFSKVGIAESVALGISLIHLLFILTLGISGGILYVAFYSRRIQSYQQNPPD